MDAYIVEAPGQARFAKVAMPVPGPYEALVRIELCVICNSTDRMIMDGTFPYPIQYPSVLGHETIGTIVEIGEKVTSYRLNDRVTRAGFRPNSSTDKIQAAWGGFAEYGIVKDLTAMKRDGRPHGPGNQTSRVIPQDMDVRDAALLISLSELFSFTRKMGDLQGKTVAVIGTGLAGLAATYFSKQLGAGQVVVIGKRASRLEIARKLGADDTLMADEPLLEKTASLFGKADILVEASGSGDALNTTLRYLKSDGLLAVYGLPEKPYTMPLSQGPDSFRIRQITPDESESMADVIEMAMNHQLPTEHLITHEWTFHELEGAFRQTREGKVIKGIVWINT